MRLTHVVIALIIFSPSFASAQSTPKPKPMPVCLGANGDLIAKPKCSGKDIKASANLLATSFASSGPQGPAGPQGPQGPAGAAGAAGSVGPTGIIDPTKCLTRSGFNSGEGVVVTRAVCNSDEFLLTHGVEPTDANVDVIEIGLLYLPNVSYPQGVQYVMGFNGSNQFLTFGITVRAVCCKP